MVDQNTQKKRGFAFVIFEDEDFVDFLFDDHKNPYHEIDGKPVCGGVFFFSSFFSAISAILAMRWTCLLMHVDWRRWR
jgi:hypothetical protein